MKINDNIGLIKRVCPKCNSEKVKRIIYGLIRLPIWKWFLPRDWIGGGCCIYHDSPAWYCVKCGYEWGNINDEYEKNIK